MFEEYTPLEERLLDYFNFIYGTALAVTGNAMEAEDIRQDVALRTLSADSADAIHIGVQYFQVSVKNVATDAWEKNQRKYSYMSEPTERPCTHDHAKQYEVKEQLKALRKIATDLEWEAVTLFAEGWTLTEIADLFGVGVDTIGQRIKRLRAKAQRIK